MYQRFRYFSLGMFLTLAFIACSPTSLVNDNVLTVDYSKPGAEVNPRMYGIFFEEINHSGDGTLYGELIMNRKNGLCKKVAQLLADLKPGFVRWPGGCMVEGATYGNHVQWKKTLGDPMQRHSEWGIWNYHCTWGFGYHEFLQFCEDLGADALFVANVGLSCSIYNGDYTEDLDYVIQDISDAIEYATGDINTPWGRKRADAGHPAPFPLKYIELGNNPVGDAYVKRYNYLYSVLKPKFPKIHFISTSQFDSNRQSLKQVDLIDRHWYVHTDFFYDHTTLFDTIPRGKYHIYVGEYAAVAAGNMDGALAEAAFMTGMERNGDLVKMASYAPLLENSSRRNWQTNLIRVKNGQAFGRSSYHVQRMFSHNIPTYNIRTTIERDLPNPIEGYIGFIGDNLSEQYRNVKVTSADGQVFMDGNDFSILTEVEEDRPNYYRLNYQKIHLFHSAPLTEGVIEFEARAIPRILKPDEPHPYFYTHKAIFNYPTLIFGSDQKGENRFNLNLGANDDNPLISVTRTIHGDTGFDRDKEGTAFNMAPEEWHKFRIILTNKNRLICLVDDELVLDKGVKPYNQIHATSGYDKETGETIIKVVNGSGEAFSTRIRLQCEKINKKGTITVLSAGSKQEENTYEHPDKIVPKTQPYRLFGKEFIHVFPPYSFTIMRVKTSEK